MHSAITSAIGALKGPLHGGANEAVFRILEAIEREKADPVEYVRKMLARRRKSRAFGHRVYHTEDPRATHLRVMSRDLGHSSGQPQWYDMSEKIEQFVRAEKKLNANVDFIPPPPTTRWASMRIYLRPYSPFRASAAGLHTSSSNWTTTA
jgi:citrate synthase